MSAVDHIGYMVSRADADACVNFYAQLGFERVAVPRSLSERAIWLSNGELAIHLIFLSAAGEPVETSRASGSHLALVVDRYAATLASLSEAGVEVDERTPHWGAERCYLSDPAGNRVELMAAPPSPSSD